jgi:hypothetical protein
MGEKNHDLRTILRVFFEFSLDSQTQQRTFDPKEREPADIVFCAGICQNDFQGMIQARVPFQGLDARH